MKQRMKKIGIASIMLVLVLLLGLAGWLIFGRRETFEENQEEKNALGIEWYDENGTEFTLTTAEEMFEFALLSGYYDFAGQTIKLGADIVICEGNAEDWANAVTYPRKAWESIYGFAGTFDGQGHTLSGIYNIGYLYTGNLFRTEQTDYVTAGLFRNTQPECVIKNFRIENSFFDSDLNYGAGCVSSYGGGTFDSIYVDAILHSTKNYPGGIVGRATDDIKITNCWFDGVINVTGGYARPTGGILAQAAEGKECIIEHCLMSGEMYNDLYQRGVNMGGIIGSTKNAHVVINDCLVTGTLNNDWQIVGSVAGNVTAETVADISHTFTTKEAWKISIGHKTGTTNGVPVAYAKEKLVGYGGYQWTTLDFDNYWAVVEGGTPVLKTFAENPLSLDGVAKLVDISWYNEEDTTFVLNDMADLYGFALLSSSSDFKGKTVKLGADITINTGNASSWEKNAPEYDWIPIGSSSLPFAGTFDGQMHTISGVYLNTTQTYSGLFSVTTDDAVVKRFSLKNSYFESSANTFGSIAGRGRGTFDTIYSNAIVKSSMQNVGGFFGQVTAGEKKLVMNNCWFDGSVTAMVNERTCAKFGGMIGFLIMEAEITNCLNSGTIDMTIHDVTTSDTSTSIQPYVGGFIGHIHKNGKATITDCMNVGDILYNAKATSSYGSIVGTASGDSTGPRAVLSGVYATKESCKRTITGYYSGQVLTYPEEQLKGYGGYQWTTLNFQKYWAAVENDTSVLKSFAKKSLNLNGVARMIDTSWYNEKESTYILTDAADFYGFALLSYTNDFAGKTVKLGADIYVNEGSRYGADGKEGTADDWSGTVAPANEWSGISSKSLPFAGTFDGQMHTIYGVYMNTSTTNSGLFNMTSDTAVLKNFSLKNSYFESTTTSLGSISGRGTGTYDTIYSDAIIVSSGANVAGMIAQVTEGTKTTLNNCWFDGTIKCVASEVTARRAGGILGFAVSGEITLTNCLNSGTIDYTACEYYRPYMGGLIAHLYKQSTVSISYSLNTGDILTTENATSSYGSIIGYADVKGTLSNVFATTESCAKTTNGSDCGQVITYNEDRIKGYGGYQWTTLDFDKEVHWAVVLDDTPIIAAFATSIPSLAGVESMLNLAWYNKTDDTFELSTAADLFGLALLAGTDDFAGKTIKLVEDIDIPNEGSAKDWGENAPDYAWNPIGSASKKFAGTFDGQGHTISGLYMSATLENSGFIAYTAPSAVITDFSITNSYLESTNASLGSVVGRAAGVMSKIYSNAIVVGEHRDIGGLVGRTSDAFEMTDCWFDGSVTNNGNETGKRYTGGLIGRILTDTALTNCLNTGVVKAEKYNVTESATDSTVRPYIGGLVGMMGNKKTLTITSCVNAGEMYYNSAANTGYGSLIGRLDASTNITVDQVYTITDYCSVIASKHNSSVQNVLSDTVTGSLADITGANAMAKMPGLFLAVNEDGTFRSDWSAVVGAAPIPAAFADGAGSSIAIDTSWYDKSGTYELSDRADIYGFALISAQVPFTTTDVVKLTEDIVINDESRYGADKIQGTEDDWSESVAPGYPWIEIASDSNYKFNGTFDGQGHNISGVYIKDSGSYGGLFGYTGADAVLKNFSLTNSYMYFYRNNAASENHGSIAGRADGGLYDSIYSDAIIVTDGHNQGGIVGRVQGGTMFTINNCQFAGSLTQTGDYAGVGGIIGKTFMPVTMTNCLNTGTISSVGTSSSQTVAGLLGYVQGAAVSISYCLNTGTIVYNPDRVAYAGAIVGTANGNYVTVSNTYMLEQGDLTGVGTNRTFTNATVDKVNANDPMYKLFLYKDAEGKHVNYWSIGANGTPVLESFKALTGIECTYVDVSWYDEDDNEFTLYDASDLYGLAMLSRETNFEGDTVKLGATIIVNEASRYGADGQEGTADDWSNTVAPSYRWMPIGADSDTLAFAGTFDGQGNTISGVYLVATGQRQGLFGRVKGTLKDFRLTNSYFYSTYHAMGSIVGRAIGGTYDTIYSDAIVVSGKDDYKGGLIGQITTPAIMKNCWFAGSVTGATNSEGLGGLIGYCKGVDMDNCMNSGKITSNSTNLEAPNVGGLIGQIVDATVTIDFCLNTGEVKPAASATGGYSFTVGSTNVATIINNSYAAIYDTCNVFAPTTNVTVGTGDTWLQAKTDILAGTATAKLLDQNLTTNWMVITGFGPILKSFQNVIAQ